MRLVMDDASDEAFFSFARSVVDAADLRLEAGFIQHGATSTLLHSIAVAYLADAYARALGYTAHLDEVRRAGLLHDYYLYDWHDGDPSRLWHGFTHGVEAVRRAACDYPDLTARERDAIERHMFPLTVRPPRSGVGWLVSTADKRCAAYETSVLAGRSYPRLRDLCAYYLPDLDLGVDRSPRRGVGLPFPSAMPRIVPVPAFAPAAVARVGLRLGSR